MASESGPWLPLGSATAKLRDPRHVTILLDFLISKMKRLDEVMPMDPVGL